MNAEQQKDGSHPGNGNLSGTQAPVAASPQTFTALGQ